MTLRMWTAPRDLPTSCGPTAKRFRKPWDTWRLRAGANPRSIVYKEVMLAALRGEF